MNSANMLLMPKEWVNRKSSIMKNGDEFYKIDILEEKDKRKFKNIEVATKIVERSASYKLHFSVKQKKILNSGGSIIIKKGKFPVDAKVTKLKNYKDNNDDSSTKDLGNKRKGCAKKLLSVPSSDYRKKLRSNLTKILPEKEKKPEPKLKIGKKHIKTKRLGDENTNFCSISGTQEIPIDDKRSRREEAASKISDLMKLGFGSIPNSEKYEIARAINLFDQTDQIFNDLSPELVNFIIIGPTEKETSTSGTSNDEIVKLTNQCELIGRLKTTPLENEPSTSDTNNEEIVKLINVYEPANRIVNNFNVSSSELVSRSKTTPLANENLTSYTKSQEIVRLINQCKSTNQNSSPELVNDPQLMIEQMDNEGLAETERITDDFHTVRDVMVIVENDPVDPNNPRRWSHEVTTIYKTSTITKIKEIHT